MEMIDLFSREVFGDEGRGIALLVDEPNLQIRQIGLEPGKAVPVHTVDASVTLQVLRGEGIFFVEGETMKMGPGKLLRIPSEASMGVVNDSQLPLVLLVIKTPQPEPLSRTATVGGAKGSFINLVDFAPLKPGKEEAFREWFRRSSEVFSRHKGFISRTLLGPIEGGSRYAALVEHESKETFMDMHLSDDREDLTHQAEPLFLGESKPHFYELLETHRHQPKNMK